MGAHLVPAPVLEHRARPRAQLRLEPGAPRGGDRPGVEVQRGREVERRRDRSHAAPARDREGHRHPHGRLEVRAQRPLQPGDQRALRRLVPPPPPPEVRRRREGGARRVQRGPGECRPLACCGRGCAVPRDARLRGARREAERHLPADVRRASSVSPASRQAARPPAARSAAERSPAALRATRGRRRSAHSAPRTAR